MSTQKSPLQLYQTDRCGELLRSLRIEAGLTQRELAERVGTSQPAIAQMETGRRSITESMARRIDRGLEWGRERRSAWRMAMARAMDAVPLDPRVICQHGHVPRENG